MHCKDCKYYKEKELKSIRMDATIFSINYGICTNPQITDDDSNEDCLCPEDGIYATCDEQRGDLMVGKMFGCVHFESNLKE